MVSQLSEDDLVELEQTEHLEEDIADNDTTASYEIIEYGIVRIEENKYRISVAPTVFFSDRFSDAFLGTRGIEVFEESYSALYRLGLLLKTPISFFEKNGYGTVADPVWWFRGRKCLYIDKYEQDSEELGVLGHREVYRPKVIAYHSSSYYRSFVYVRMNANRPIGLYDYPDGYIDDIKQDFGYYREEYAIFENQFITREEFDDGAAVLEGKVFKTNGLAKLRMRYFTDYNLIICAKFHPLNNIDVSMDFEAVMDQLLANNEDSFEELVDFVERLPKHRSDD